jgi:glycosyltransferase involved in cell wall biosynthesis
VGRIVEWKGQLQFLQAAAVAFARRPDAIAVVVGDVTDDSEAYGRQLRLEAERLGIAGRVVFAGFIADPRQAYALLDVLVHSAITPEPFGLVVTEAMALGIPVIAAASGGPLEIVTDGVNGYLRDPTDTSEVGAILAELLGDAGQRRRIGDAGRRSALADFDPDRYVERLAEVYDRLLGRGSA